MTAFTDDDKMKLLKQCASYGADVDWNTSITVRGLVALLCRMEAAEKFRNETLRELAKDNPFCMSRGMIIADDNWRKAAGKDDGELPSKFAHTNRID